VPAGSPSESPIRSCSRRSGIGAHQFHFPSRPISAGTRNERTTNASTSTPTAVAIPICWMKEIELVLNAPIATASRIAAAVTTLPVRPSPVATASRSARPDSRASLIRPSRKTP
jgi:hypothetical protein